MSGLIYVLVDPRAPDVPRYVGQTSRPLTVRLAAHLLKARKGGHEISARGIRKLLADGISPEIKAIDSAETESDLNALERKHIAAFRSAGLRLWNITDGGEGTRGYSPPPDVTARRVAALRKTWASPEARERVSLASKNRWESADFREKTIAATRAALARPEVREKHAASAARQDVRARQSAAKLGGTLSLEHRRKISLSLKGRRRTQEHQEKLNAARRGRYRWSEEQRLRYSATRRGQPWSPEAYKARGLQCP